MKWFLLFLSLPIIEIFIFLKINEIFGILYTISLIISTAFIGLLFVKRQGKEVIKRLTDKTDNPLILIPHGLILLIAGILLLTPGFITDTVGFSLLIRSIRNRIILEITKRIRAI